MRALLIATAVATLALPAAAHAHAERRAAGFEGERCAGAPIAATEVLTGTLGAAQVGSYVMVPFVVPSGTTQVRVKYCWDAPDQQLPQGGGHTLDLGLWDAQANADAGWTEADFRGWGGSSHPDVRITPQGFAPGYSPTNRVNVDGFTTRGFVPGAIAPGRWAAELGVAGIQPVGDADGLVRWRVEIELRSDAGFDDTPYEPVRYDSSPARAGAGWYKGDVHVHGEHSAFGDATLEELSDFAFGPRPGGAGLDFVTLSDYVTTSGWGEAGRLRARHPDNLVVRSAEVITYRGHANNHGSLRYVDHRTGPVHELMPDGSLRQLRAARPASEILRAIRDGGGWSQINHPTIFPSAVPAFALLCRGCPWDHSAAETDYSLADAIEVSTGPGGLQGPDVGPNPFTPLAIDFYERALASGARIAAVGSSDSHNAGRRNDQVTQSPIGQATTVVYADELSEAGVRRAVQARHTFVKVFASDRPDLRFEAVVAGHEAEPPAIMGDVVRAAAAKLTARVLGADPTYQLLVVKDGVTVLILPVTGADFAHTFDSLGTGRYRLQLQRGTTIEAISSPIWLDPSAPAVPARSGSAAPNSLRLRAARVQRVQRLRARCDARGYGLRECRARLRARDGRRVLTIASGTSALRGGRAIVRLRMTRAGRALLARRGGRLRATLELRAVGTHGTLGPRRRQVTLSAR